ncbi:MAG: dihydrodipicolinate synthase family protein [Lachnospiraceae bacterium]|nr:dihydrodipicolinate synthase family protein [Lachnospiraceae bacterium]
MSEMRFPGGVWPVMLAPFTKTGAVDYEGLKQLTEWYIGCGCEGLFAVCQSSEMYFLTLDERVQIAKTVVETAAGRVPVIASGNICEAPEERVEETNRIAGTGVDAVILITNQFAAPEESDEVWLDNCMSFIEQINPEVPLGFYECPYPYKRLISLENLKACADTGRFYFLKDTCCDEALIEERLKQVEGSRLKLYNANSTTLLKSLRAGAVGFSGVMANFHPKLYVYLCEHFKEKEVEELQAFLAIASLIERQYYPVNAKYYIQKYTGVPITTFSRRQDDKGLTETFKMEVDMLRCLEAKFGEKFGLQPDRRCI